jgi:hypothetical protein
MPHIQYCTSTSKHFTKPQLNHDTVSKNLNKSLRPAGKAFAVENYDFKQETVVRVPYWCPNANSKSIPRWFPANHRTIMDFSLPRIQAAWWSVVDWAGAYGFTFCPVIHFQPFLDGCFVVEHDWTVEKLVLRGPELYWWNLKMDGNKWFCGQHFYINCRKQKFYFLNQQILCMSS